MILIVDDEPMILDLLKLSLTYLGIKIYTTCSGLEALSLIENENIELLITDYLMPDIKGDKILNIFYKKNPNKPMVLITGCYDIESKVERTLLLKTTVILKPFRMDLFKQSIEDLLRI